MKWIIKVAKVVDFKCWGQIWWLKSDLLPQILFLFFFFLFWAVLKKLMQQEFDLELKQLDGYTETVRSEKHLDPSESENYTGKEPTATVSGVLQIHLVRK